MKENNFLSHIEWIILFLTLVGGFYSIDGRIDAINSRFDQFMMVWHEEAKNFHGRVCQLEKKD